MGRESADQSGKLRRLEEVRDSRIHATSNTRPSLSRIRERFTPLVDLCKKRGIAMRIGTNHGSLSDRILNRYGDTPLGMVESALEFARIARDLDYHDFIFSMKASNPKVMIAAYRLLVARLNELGPDWNYPIHLGVTEAGEGEDARIKSAIGIGSLLADGIGDTIRVSLTEDSPHEIPVAKELVRSVRKRGQPTQSEIRNPKSEISFDPFSYQRRATETIERDGVRLGGEELIRVVVRQAQLRQDRAQDRPDGRLPAGDCLRKRAGSGDRSARRRGDCALNQDRRCAIGDGERRRRSSGDRGVSFAGGEAATARHPILLKECMNDLSTDDRLRSFSSKTLLHRGSTNIGSLLCDGIGDAILVQGEQAPGQALRLPTTSCRPPGRGFSRPITSRVHPADARCSICKRRRRKIKAATLHLKGVKIAIMGCIVNGPGEMADADFGYVGGAPGKVNLYVGKTAVKFNIPEAEAVDRLKDLIREHGKWIEPPLSQAAMV